MSESSDDDGAMGFMFESAEAKVMGTFEFEGIAATIEYIDEEAGAVISGHYLWPAAPGMCTFLVKNWSEYTEGVQTVVELGAGVGLAGLISAQLEPSVDVMITDHDPTVLECIIANIARLPAASAARCRAEDLGWGEEHGAASLAALKASLPAAQDGGPSRCFVIGSDVIYSKEVVGLLFWTVSALLGAADGAAAPRVFLMCSSFGYDEETEQAIDSASALYGLERRILSCELKVGGCRLQTFTRGVPVPAGDQAA
jgi:predicted nicotinamide N-methyase